MKSRALTDERLAGLHLTVPIPENLPSVLQEFIESCALMVTEPGRFPELGGDHGQARFQFTGSMRVRDLRRREGHALVCMCIGLHLDLVRDRVGKPRRDGSADAVQLARPRPREGRDSTYIDRFTQTTFESETGLGRTALFEALRDLKDAGYIDVQQPVSRYESELTPGQWSFRGFPAVITVKRLLWQRLGYDVAPEGYLDQQKKLATKREKEGVPDEVLSDIRKARLERQTAIRKNRLLRRRPPAIHGTDGRAAIAAYERRVTSSVSSTLEEAQLREATEAFEKSIGPRKRE